MKNNPLLQLGLLGQSVWMDYIRRDLLIAGASPDTPLQRLINDDGLRGITSNPSIFEKAIVDSHDYDEVIRPLALEGFGAKEIYERLTKRDVQMAADQFRPLYEKTNGNDGYVSLEVNPHLAHDTQGTVEEATRLWNSLNRPNVFIKIPATDEGLPAVKQLISEGVNVNVTLLFGINRYRQFAESYIEGIETRLSKGKDVTRVASVASFFLSRIDSLVDPQLDQIIAHQDNNANIARQVRGQVAVACAQTAYQLYKRIFYSQLFKNLAEKGARVQRVLWASTGTKNPEYSDIKYIEALIGPDTINTIPVETLNAYRDHGDPKVRLEHDIELSSWVLERLNDLGIDIDTVARQLEKDGLEKFNKPFDTLMEKLGSMGK